MTLNDCYQKLELPITATMAETKQAYKQLVKHWHPDRFDADSPLQAYAEERLKLINAAYDFICRYQTKNKIRQSGPSEDHRDLSSHKRTTPYSTSSKINDRSRGLFWMLADIWKTWQKIFDTTNRPPFYSRTAKTPRSLQKGRQKILNHALQNYESHQPADKKKNYGLDNAYYLRYGYGIRRKRNSGTVSSIESIDRCHTVHRVNKISPARRV